MKKEIMRIKVDDELMNQLQRAHFDVQTRQSIITTLMENHAIDGNSSVLQSEAFSTYHKELELAFANLELLKSAITAEYIPDEAKAQNDARWEADFSSGELVIFA